MDIINIALDAILLLVILIPIIRGFKSGLVDTALRFGKTFIAFGLACAFAKKVGLMLRDRIYPFVYEKIAGIFQGETADTLSSTAMLEKIPEGVKEAMNLSGFDVEQMASDAAAEGASMIDAFVESISTGATGMLSYLVAFAAIFLATLIAIAILRPVINFIVRHLPIVKTCNTLLGGVFGVLVGLLLAWGMSQVMVGVLGLVIHHDWSGTYVLSFFYRVNPLKWLASIAMQSMSAIAGV